MGGSSTDSWRKKLDGRTLWAVNSRMALSIQKQSVNVIIWESFSLYAIYIIYQLRSHHKHASSLKYRIPSRYLWNRHTRWVWLKFGKLHYSSTFAGCDVSLEHYIIAARILDMTSVWTFYLQHLLFPLATSYPYQRKSTPDKPLKQDGHL